MRQKTFDLLMTLTVIILVLTILSFGWGVITFREAISGWCTATATLLLAWLFV